MQLILLSIILSYSSVTDFKEVLRVEFSSDYLIRGLPNFVFNDDLSKIAVHDVLSGEIALFNGDGEFVSTLNTEECFPGMNWTPRTFTFDNESNLIVTNFGFPTGVWFDKDGQCINHIYNDFRSPQMISTLGDKLIAAYSSRAMRPDNPTYHVDVFRKNGERLKTIHEDNEHFGFLRDSSPYHVMERGPSIMFFGIASKPEINMLKIINGEIIKVNYEVKPSFFVDFGSDMNLRNVTSLDEWSRSRNEYIRDKYLLDNIFIINDEELLLRFKMNRSNDKCVLFNTEKHTIEENFFDEDSNEKISCSDILTIKNERILVLEKMESKHDGNELFNLVVYEK